MTALLAQIRKAIFAAVGAAGSVIVAAYLNGHGAITPADWGVAAAAAVVAGFAVYRIPNAAAAPAKPTVVPPGG